MLIGSLYMWIGRSHKLICYMYVLLVLRPSSGDLISFLPTCLYFHRLPLGGVVDCLMRLIVLFHDVESTNTGLCAE